MALFDSFVDKAKDKLDDFQNPSGKAVNKRLRNQHPTPKIPDEPIEENNKKEKEKKKKGKKELDNFEDNDFYDNESFNYGEDYKEDQIGLFPAQKSESFHFFILENQYQDLERAIRGVKDVWSKEKEKWEIKRRKAHCFTDEESEEIVRTAQSHLSSDIKLAIFNRTEYPILLESIYNQLWVMFKCFMDYRFGRFGSLTDQLKMKQQALNIFNMLMMRIKANYSRAIEGRENTATHESVKGQESLSHTERKDPGRSYT